MKEKIAASYLLLVLFAVFVWLFPLALYFLLLCLSLCTVPVVTTFTSADPRAWLAVLSLTIAKSPFCEVFPLVSSLAVVLCVYYGDGGEEEGCECDALGSILGLSKGKNRQCAQPILRCNSRKSRGPNKLII